MAEDRVRTRRSEIRGGRKASVTATLFTRHETDGTSGEFVSAMRSYESNAVDDPFINAIGGNSSYALLSPDFPAYSLLKLPNESSTLRQCIDAMVTNINSFGYRMEYIGEKGQEDSPASQAEKARIVSLMETPNGEYTMTELRERSRRDKETFGYAFTEIGRDIAGRIVMMNHVPAHTVRMTAKLDELVPVDEYLERDGKLLKVRINKRFRRFVQQIGAKMVYFKEFGDPRKIDRKTGLVNDALQFSEEATEMYHHTLYSPGSPYGVPRWVGNLPAIRGTRESELCNLQFFQDNAIPAMAILVSGGALTGDTVGNLESHFTTARGRGSMHRVVVIEATGDADAAKVDGSIPPPKLEMKPLGNDRQKDGLFEKYEEANERKIRSSFRLPPLFVGRSEDYTHATADASMVMADAQVFGPERNKEDDLWNTQFLTVDHQPLQYWRMRTNPPRLVSADSVLTALNTLDDLGAITPNIAIGIANELFDLALTPIEQDWGNFPFPIVMQLCLNNNLKGIEQIEKIADLLEQQNGRENDAAELAKTALDTPKDARKPNPRGGGAAAKKPKADGAEAGPGKTQSAKSEAQDKVTWLFRTHAGRGNDMPAAYAHRARKRTRTNPPKMAVA